LNRELSKAFIALLFPTGEFPCLLCLAFLHWIKMLLVLEIEIFWAILFFSIDEGCGFFLSLAFLILSFIVPKIEGYHTLYILLSFFG
jgi:hypothetical protein